MSARRTHKDQHYIPAGYLRAWCDPDCPADREPYVWLFEKESIAGRNKAPRNIFSEIDFYTETRPDGERDLSIEHFLSFIETRFVETLRRKIEPRTELDLEDRATLCAFCAAMNARSRAMREHVRSQWQPLLEHSEELEAWARTATKEQLKSLASPFPRPKDSPRLTTADLRRIVANPAQTAVRNMLPIEMQVYARMHLAVFHTADPIGFITTDNPCIWFDPELQKTPAAWRAPGLGSPTIEVLLPLSPSSLAFFNWQGISGYRPASDALVNELNRMLRFQADEAYVVRKNVTKDYWFEKAPPRPL